MPIMGKTVRIVAASIVALCLLVGGGWWWLNTHNNTPAGDGGGAGTAILIPGYGGDQTDLETIAAALKAKGVNTVTLDIGNGGGDISDYADALVAKTAQTEGKVAWIGYSMGGLVALVGSENLGDKVTQVATLASPLHGTSVAGVANMAGLCDEACKQMVPGSELLASTPTTSPIGTRWLTITTSADQIVTGNNTAALNGANNINLDSCQPPTQPTHGQIPTNPTVVSLVVANTLGQQVTC